jgi:hypothetical protein
LIPATRKARLHGRSVSFPIRRTAHDCNGDD